jgi:type VII secretion integral membrane protein EccD
VLTPTARADVCLPADVPVAELVPMLMELLGTSVPPDDRPVPWRLTGAGGGVLPPDATLDELGVRDGELLRLGPAVPPPPAPVFDDPVDALAALAAPTAEPDRRRSSVVVLLGVVPAAALLLGGMRADEVGGAFFWTAVALAGLSAVGAIAMAAQLRRQDAGPERSAALLPALCAVPLAAAAGWAAAPGPPGTGPLLLAAVTAGTAAALAQVAVRTAAASLIGTALAAVLFAAAAAVHLRFATPTHTIAAVTAAIALAAGPLLPRLVLRMAGLPRPVVPTDATALTAADSGPDLLPPAELAARSRLARTELAGLSGGCATVAAVAAPLAVTGGASGWTGPMLAATIAAVLLLRARGFIDPTTARIHLAAGTAVVVTSVVAAAPALGPPGRLAGALALLGGAAAVVTALGRPAAASPVARRAVDVVEAVLTAAVAPLALAAAGVFALVRGL